MRNGEVFRYEHTRSPRDAAITFQEIKERGFVTQHEKPRLRNRMNAVSKTIWRHPLKTGRVALYAGVFAGLFAVTKYGFIPYAKPGLVIPSYESYGLSISIASLVTGLYYPFLNDFTSENNEQKVNAMKSEAKPGEKYPHKAPGSIREAYRTGEVQPRRLVFVRGQVTQRPLHL